MLIRLRITEECGHVEVLCFTFNDVGKEDGVVIFVSIIRHWGEVETGVNKLVSTSPQCCWEDDLLEMKNLDY